MSQNSPIIIENQGFPAFRADMNNSLTALVSNNSGATEPSTTYAYSFWFDTSTNLLKLRNADNDAWITLAFFDQTNDEWEIRSAVIQAVDGAGVSIKTDDGTTRISVSDAGVVSFENYSFPSADGTANQVLQTDGSGNLTFASVSASAQGLFRKADPTAVAWTKTGAGTAETQTEMYVEVNGTILTVASGTSITMPTLAAGTDYAIWLETDGDLVATTNHTSPPTANARKVGGFHYAPGGNATISATGDWTTHSGGDTTPQINEYSFYDLKWRPSAPDPRGLTLVNNSFWTGMYLMSSGDGAGPLHRYNVNPCRDGNAPFKPYATTPTRYSNAIPLNISETLMYNGFRMPNIDEFQLLALGTTEQTSLGGSGPGNTGVLTSGAGTKERFTSAWGVFDSTGVLRVWGRDGSADQTTGTVTGVSQGRTNDLFRISRFARFGGDWPSAAASGSRYVTTSTASTSNSFVGGRGVCDHLILD